jgi:hypothetical protein
MEGGTAPLQWAARGGQPTLAGGAELRHYRVHAAQVVELVEASVAPTTENLKLMLAEAAIALRRPAGGDVHGNS